MEIVITMTAAATMMIKEKPSLKLRHEIKYTIDPLNDWIVSHRLRKLFKHDKNADSHGNYRVSSLYFDTPNDSALRQKIDGVDRREKFRIRYYNSDLSFIRLEKKIKINGLCSKYSARISAEETERLIKGDIRFLLESDEPLFIELYSKIQGRLLRPMTIVTYDREAFLYEPGNVRITIDRNLRTGMRSIDFLNHDLYHADVSEQLPVLEIKYDEFLPEIVRMAVNINQKATAYSKYAVCRRYD